MMLFNELRISPDGKYLIVDVLILELPYFENTYIDSITILTSSQFKSTNTDPSIPITGKGTTIECGEAVKHYRNYIDIDGMGKNVIFFVYVQSKGEIADNTPCELKDSMILGVTYNKLPFYQLTMKMLNSMNGCEPPKELIDFILQLKAFDISLLTGNYLKAIDYWDLFFNDVDNKPISNNCGCYGKFR